MRSDSDSLAAPVAWQRPFRVNGRVEASWFGNLSRIESTPAGDAGEVRQVGCGWADRGVDLARFGRSGQAMLWSMVRRMTERSQCARLELRHLLALQANYGVRIVPQGGGPLGLHAVGGQPAGRRSRADRRPD